MPNIMEAFACGPSKYNDTYTVKNSPWRDGKGDMIRELVDACHAEGLLVGMYLSPWDRNHKDYGKQEYVNYYYNQWEELLTDYGPCFRGVGSTVPMVVMAGMGAPERTAQLIDVPITDLTGFFL